MVQHRINEENAKSETGWVLPVSAPEGGVVTPQQGKMPVKTWIVDGSESERKVRPHAAPPAGVCLIVSGTVRTLKKVV